MSEPRTKGENLKALLGCLCETRGQAVLDATLSRVDAEIADGVRRGSVVSGGWYPLSWYAHLHRAAAEVTGEGPELARELGRESTLQMFTGVYRFFSFALTPESVVARSQKTFALVYDTGAIEVLQAKKGLTRLQFSGCEGFNPLLWEAQLGAREAIIALGRGKSIQTRVLAGGGHLANLRVEYTWKGDSGSHRGSKGASLPILARAAGAGNVFTSKRSG